MRVTFDANQFINAVNPMTVAYADLQTILAGRTAGRLGLTVSLHTIHELEIKPDAALALARTAVVLPYYPIGSWDDLVGTWNDLAGTWDDIRRNDSARQTIERLAKAGASIRDAGAYIDALRARVDYFVTSDRALVDPGPLSRIQSQFGLKIVSPAELAAML